MEEILERIARLERRVSELENKKNAASELRTVSEVRRKAGLRSADVRKSIFGTAQPPRNARTCSNKPRTNSNKTELPPNKPRTQSNKHRTAVEQTPNKLEQTPNKTAVDEGPTPISRVRRTFLECFEKEFATPYPGWGAKESGQAKTWLRSISLPQALQYCTLYPKWNDPWISRQGHPFGLLVSQYVKLDAWSKRAASVVEKIAEGRAQENVALKQVQSIKEIALYAELSERRTAKDLELSSPVQGALQESAPGILPWRSDSSLSSAQTYSQAGEDDPK